MIFFNFNLPIPRFGIPLTLPHPLDRSWWRGSASPRFSPIPWFEPVICARRSSAQLFASWGKVVWRTCPRTLLIASSNNTWGIYLEFISRKRLSKALLDFLHFDDERSEIYAISLSSLFASNFKITSEAANVYDLMTYIIEFLILTYWSNTYLLDSDFLNSYLHCTHYVIFFPPWKPYLDSAEESRR